MNKQLVFALLWSAIFIADLITALTGGSADWIMVFCPLAIVVLDMWIKYLESVE